MIYKHTHTHKMSCLYTQDNNLVTLLEEPPRKQIRGVFLSATFREKKQQHSKCYQTPMITLVEFQTNPISFLTGIQSNFQSWVDSKFDHQIFAHSIKLRTLFQPSTGKFQTDLICLLDSDSTAAITDINKLHLGFCFCPFLVLKRDVDLSDLDSIRTWDQFICGQPLLLNVGSIIYHY